MENYQLLCLQGSQGQVHFLSSRIRELTLKFIYREIFISLQNFMSAYISFHTLGNKMAMVELPFLKDVFLLISKQK